MYVTKCEVSIAIYIIEVYIKCYVNNNIILLNIILNGRQQNLIIIDLLDFLTFSYLQKREDIKNYINRNFFMLPKVI